MDPHLQYGTVASGAMLLGENADADVENNLPLAKEKMLAA